MHNQHNLTQTQDLVQLGTIDPIPVLLREALLWVV